MKVKCLDVTAQVRRTVAKKDGDNGVSVLFAGKDLDFFRLKMTEAEFLRFARSVAEVLSGIETYTMIYPEE